MARACLTLGRVVTRNVPPMTRTRCREKGDDDDEDEDDDDNDAPSSDKDYFSEVDCVKVTLFLDIPVRLVSLEHGPG